MEERVIEILLDGGVAAALAMLMFFFYRKDSNEWTRRWESATQEARETRATERADLITVIRDNTQALTALRDKIARDQMP